MYGSTRRRLLCADAWDPSVDSVGVAGYYVYGDKVNGPGEDKDPVRVVVDKPEYTVRGLGCGQSADLTLVAFDDSHNRSDRSNATVTPPPARTRSRPHRRQGSCRSRRARTRSCSPGPLPSDNVGVVEYAVYRDLQRTTSFAEPSAIGGLACGSTTRTPSTPLTPPAIARRSARCLCERLPARRRCCQATPPPPSTPTGLAASFVSQTGLALSWNASSDNVAVTGYDVYRNGAKVASGSAASASQ